MLVIAGQTSGPNLLTFFREPMGAREGNIVYKNLIFFKAGAVTP